MVDEPPHGLGGWGWPGTAAPCALDLSVVLQETLLLVHGAGELVLPSVGCTGVVW